jgi:single-strand DNA-binding protein
MKSINRVFLVGRLGSDPEMKTTKNGKTYARLSLATDKWSKLEDGKWEQKTEWHKVTVWGHEATKCADRLSKGAPVFVEGELSRYNYEQNGEKRFQTSITAQAISFLGLPVSSVSAS